MSLDSELQLGDAVGLEEQSLANLGDCEGSPTLTAEISLRAGLEPEERTWGRLLLTLYAGNL